jgi:Fe2+ transport system protein FeoA
LIPTPSNQRLRKTAIKRKYEKMTAHQAVPLHTISKGSRVHIVKVPEGKWKNQLIRMGILKGEFIKCLERLPGGTMVIEKDRREIAIGMTLAKTILVVYASTEHA